MSSISIQNFLYSCEETIKRGHEQFIAEHSFGYILSGETHYHTVQGTELYGPGTIGLIRRNQLAKTIKIPATNNIPYRAVNIILDQEFLKKYSSDNNIPQQKPYSGPAMVNLSGDVFIQSYFESLHLYFEQPGAFTTNLVALKTNEAVELLLRARPDLKSFLFDFNDPHKIDLEAFMNQNYMFNISLDKFARFTGRSLAAFKRDFNKVFDLPPEKWLQEKRLDKAHFLIKDRGQRVSEVYLDVGFENLSHFSRCFKQHYGYTPSSVQGHIRL